MTETVTDKENSNAFVCVTKRLKHAMTLCSDMFYSLKALTCNYCADQNKDTEKDVSCQRAEAVHDLPLADGEYNSKHLCTQNIRTCNCKFP